MEGGEGVGAISMDEARVVCNAPLLVPVMYVP